jgi:hypothetical protein
MGIRDPQVARIQNWRRTIRSSEARGDTRNAAFAREQLRNARDNATEEERAAADERGI